MESSAMLQKARQHSATLTRQNTVGHLSVALVVDMHHFPVKLSRGSLMDAIISPHAKLRKWLYMTGDACWWQKVCWLACNRTFPTQSSGARQTGMMHSLQEDVTGHACDDPPRQIKRGLFPRESQLRAVKEDV